MVSLSSNKQPKTEIVAMASGKGGTGKTILSSCLGFALTKAGHSVLMIDADPATDGLSLFLLGPSGMGQIDQFEPQNTFVGILQGYQQTRALKFEAHPIHRSGAGDHGVSYEAIISGKGLYGDDETSRTMSTAGLDQDTFRAAITALFQELRSSGRYDYVLVDTRGGFSFESTDICALADSFLVVCEPHVTGFYQDRNLLRRISGAADELKSKAILRAFIVNKATESQATESELGKGPMLDLTKLEFSFRHELTKEFKIEYESTYAVPIDIDAIDAYKVQQIPYVKAPASLFSYATLWAYSDILRVVTSKWAKDRVDNWNSLVDKVSQEIERKNSETQRKQEEQDNRINELKSLREQTQFQSARIEDLKREIERIGKQHDREVERVETLVSVAKESGLKRYFFRFRSEVVWAILLSVLVTFSLSVYFNAAASPRYKIYIVVNSNAERDTLSDIQTLIQASGEGIRLDGVPVRTQVEVLAENTAEAAKTIAQDILNRNDALLVIGYLNSQPVEASLPIYFMARPQLPFIAAIATDDDLLVQCREQGNSCFQSTDTVPLLQLPPANQVQAASAVQFARQHGKRRFFLVSDGDPSNRAYSENLLEGYQNEIDQSNDGNSAKKTDTKHSNDPNPGERIQLVGLVRGDLQIGSDVKRLRPDCVLYAGGSAGARALLGAVSSSKVGPMVILSDASLDPGISSRDLSQPYPLDPGISTRELAQYRDVYFTYPLSAQDYNTHKTALVRDGFSIARNLISDTNANAFGLSFRLRSWLHMLTANDMRENLVTVMRRNSASHISYLAPSGGLYIFNGYKRANGSFHILGLGSFGQLVEATAQDSQ